MAISIIVCLQIFHKIYVSVPSMHTQRVRNGHRKLFFGFVSNYRKERSWNSSRMLKLDFGDFWAWKRNVNLMMYAGLMLGSYILMRHFSGCSDVRRIGYCTKCEKAVDPERVSPSILIASTHFYLINIWSHAAMARNVLFFVDAPFK